MRRISDRLKLPACIHRNRIFVSHPVLTVLSRSTATILSKVDIAF
jgi:hypothetical protein